MESQNNSTRLETILQDFQGPQQIEGIEYQTHIDVYEPGTHVMYISFDSTPKSPFTGANIGSQGSGFVGGNQDNIRRPLYQNEEISMQERYDFNEKNGEAPHYNIDYGPDEKDRASLTRNLKEVINNSKRFSEEDKEELIKDLHYTHLFPDDQNEQK